MTKIIDELTREIEDKALELLDDGSGTDIKDVHDKVRSALTRVRQATLEDCYDIVCTLPAREITAEIEKLRTNNQ